MSGYFYNDHKPHIFTEQGQIDFLKMRDHCRELLEKAGAFRMDKAMSCLSGDSWFIMACVDRLVEIGEIAELPRQSWGQFRVFTDPKVHNR